MTDHQHTADVLNRAADLIEERGWVGTGGQGWGGDDSPLCLEGAINTAYGLPDAMFTTANTCPAGRAVRDYLDLGDYTGAGSALFCWNDEVRYQYGELVPQRTAAEVVEVLRATAVIEQARADEHTATDTGYDSAAEMLLIGAAGAAIAGGGLRG